ncbi:MAG: ACT domain-containing protein [Myxococcota bacterium]
MQKISIIRLSHKMFDSTDNIKRSVEIIKRHFDSQERLIIIVPYIRKFYDSLNETISNFYTINLESERNQLYRPTENISSRILKFALLSKGIYTLEFDQNLIQIPKRKLFSEPTIPDFYREFIEKNLDRGTVLLVSGLSVIDEKGQIDRILGGTDRVTPILFARLLGQNKVIYYREDLLFFTSNREFVRKARLIKDLDYDEAANILSNNDSSFDIDDLMLAKEWNIEIEFRNFYEPEKYTLISGGKMKKNIVKSIIGDPNKAKVSIHQVQDRPGVAARIFSPLVENGIQIFDISNIVTIDGLSDISFTVLRDDAKRAYIITEKFAKECGASSVEYDDNIAVISVIGSGLYKNPDIAFKIFSVLAKNRININYINANDIKISVAINRDYLELALRLLHETFEMDKDE